MVDKLLTFYQQIKFCGKMWKTLIFLLFTCLFAVFHLWIVENFWYFGKKLWKN